MICLNTNIAVLIIISIIIIAYYYHFQLVLLGQQINKKCQIQQNKTVKKIIIQPSPNTKPVDIVEETDKENLINPLRYPEERLDRHNLYLKNLAMESTYSRGYPDTPKLRGYIYEIADDNSRRRILPLFGYETYPNSRRIRYYTILNNVGLNKYLAPKIEIEYKIVNNRKTKINNQELYDDDIIQMNDLDESKFIVKRIVKDQFLF
jgi:hypothetical protein